MKIPVSKDKSNLGLGQERTLTLTDLLEELDDYIEERHLPMIKEIEELYRKRLWEEERRKNENMLKMWE